MDMTLTKKAVGDAVFYIYEMKEKIDLIAVEMLRYNPIIPGFLPFSVVRQDEKCIARYEITGLITLKEYKRALLGRERMLSFFVSALQAGEAAEEYMLCRDNFLLTDETVCIEPKTGKVHFLYLPLSGNGYYNLLTFLKNALSYLSPNTGENTGYFFALQNIVKNPKIDSAKAFLNALQELQETYEKTESPVKKNENERREREGEIENKPQSLVSGQNDSKYKEQVKREKKINLFARKEKELKKQKEKKKRERAKPEISPAVFGFDIPGMDKKEELPGSRQQPVSQAANNSFRLHLCEDVEVHTVMGEAVKKGFQTEEISDIRFGDAVQSMAWILRQSNGQKMEIDKEIFKLGRSGANSDFCIMDNLEVGREHAEIRHIGSEYYFVDMHSRNCSYVNSVKVIPEQAVRLKDGDQIRLANELFLFSIEKC